MSVSRRTRPKCIWPAQLSKKKRKARLDKLAAQILLTGYLERQRSGMEHRDDSLQGLDD